MSYQNHDSDSDREYNNKNNIDDESDDKNKSCEGGCGVTPNHTLTQINHPLSHHITSTTLTIITTTTSITIHFHIKITIDDFKSIITTTFSFFDSNNE